MGASVSVSQTFLRLIGHKVLDGGLLTMLHDLVYLLCQVFLLLACSWAGGFVSGVGVAADALGQCILVCVAVPFLFG